MNAQTPRDNQRAAAYMAGAAFGFSTMFALAHSLRAELPWPVVAFARCFVNLIVVAMLLWWTRTLPVIRGRASLWVRSLAGSTALMLTFYTTSRLPVTDTVVIFATTPIWITLIMSLLGRGRPPVGAWIHIALAVGGVYVMYRPKFDAASLPLLLALAGAVASAIAMVALSMSRDFPHTAIVAHFSAVASLVTLTLSVPVFNANSAAALTMPHNLIILLIVGIAATAGQLLLTAAYARGNPTLVSLVGLTQIIFGAAYDVVVFSHRPDGWKAAGVLLILSGIILNLVQSRRSNEEPV